MADDENKNEKSGLALGDAVKKLFTAGVSAAFMTEENVRAYLADLRLPKEILSVILQSANKQKEEIANRVSKEVVNLISKVDVAKEMGRLAETHKFRITAEIEILPRETSGKTTREVQVKKSGAEGSGEQPS